MRHQRFRTFISSPLIVVYHCYLTNIYCYWISHFQSTVINLIYEIKIFVTELYMRSVYVLTQLQRYGKEGNLSGISLWQQSVWWIKKHSFFVQHGNRWVNKLLTLANNHNPDNISHPNYHNSHPIVVKLLDGCTIHNIWIIFHTLTTTTVTLLWLSCLMDVPYTIFQTCGYRWTNQQSCEGRYQPMGIWRKIKWCK